MTAGYLIDTSAFVRLSKEEGINQKWLDARAAGLLGVCAITELEIFYSARSIAHRNEIADRLDNGCCWVETPARAFLRAADVQRRLIERGTHRSAGPVDLVVAATADLLGLQVLHYDADFEQIAEVTGQPIEWIATPGSID